MKQLDEQHIIKQIHNPDTVRAAFTQIVDAYGQTLYWQIRRMVQSHDDADDILQNTFIKAWSNIQSFRGDSKLATWLHRIAYNETITFINNQRSTVSLDESLKATDDDDSALTLANTLQSDPYFDGDATEAQLQAAIASLPEKQRAVFIMKYYQEMRYEDIAAITSTTVGALKASYHIAVKKIEDFFNSHD